MAYKKEWPVLIVCPGGVKYTWKSELRKWLGVSETKIQIIEHGKQRVNIKARFVITSYDICKAVSGELREKDFQVIVVDEAHGLKNIESARSKLIVPLAKKAKRLVLLTGTPILAKPYEAFPILNMLRPDIFGDFTSYSERYCVIEMPHDKGFKKYNGCTFNRELHFIFQRMMIRRLKADILNQLPPKIRTKVEINVDEKSAQEIVQQLYLSGGITDEDLDKIDIAESIASDQEDEKSGDEGGDGNKKSKKGNKTKKVGLKNLWKDQKSKMEGKPDKKGVAGSLYLETGKAKLPGIKDYLMNLFQKETKFIVFGYHHCVLDAIKQWCEDEDINYIFIDGSVKTELRHERVQEFQTNANTKVAILSIAAAATGITLTEASLVVFAELYWTPAIMIQAEDRAHRIGQTAESVNIIYLYGRRTLDDKIFTQLERKLNIVTSTLDNNQKGFNFVETDKDKAEQNGTGGNTDLLSLQSSPSIRSAMSHANPDAGDFDLRGHDDDVGDLDAIERDLLGKNQAGVKRDSKRSHPDPELSQFRSPKGH